MRSRHDRGDGGSRLEPEGPPVERKSVVLPGDRKRLAELSGARAEAANVLEAAPPTLHGDPFRRLESPDERSLRYALVAAHEIQAPVDPVRAVDVRMARRAEHRRVARGSTAAVAVTRGILVVVRLDLDDPSTDAVDEERHADEIGGNLVDAASEELLADHEPGFAS
jgi:hypothetical protein